MQSRRKNAYLFGIGLASLAAPAMGDAATWVGKGSDNAWSTAANWDPAVVPENGIGGNPSFAVVIDSAAVAFAPTSNVTVTSIALSGGADLWVTNAKYLTSASTTAEDEDNDRDDAHISVDAGATFSAGDFTMNSGSITIATGGTFIASTGFSMASGNLQVNGELAVGANSIAASIGGTGTITGIVNARRGIVPDGTLSVTGALVLYQDESELTIDIDGSACDMLDVSGSATLGGRLLEIYLPNGTAGILANQPYTIVQAGSISGEFDNINSIDGLRVDATAWVDTLDGESGEYVVGSFRVNYTTTSVFLDDFTPVPEPGSLLTLLGIGTMSLLCRRRPRCR